MVKFEFLSTCSHSCTTLRCCHLPPALVSLGRGANSGLLQQCLTFRTSIAYGTWLRFLRGLAASASALAAAAAYTAFKAGGKNTSDSGWCKQQHVVFSSKTVTCTVCKMMTPVQQKLCLNTSEFSLLKVQLCRVLARQPAPGAPAWGGSAVCADLSCCAAAALCTAVNQ